jgi:hypothetical protein
VSINRRFFLLSSATIVASILLGKKSQAATCSVVSVKDYGAIGDGVADDTAAIQTAIGLGCSVYFPAGTYKVNGLKLKSNATYYGDGDSSVIKLFQKSFARRQIINLQSSNSAFDLDNLQKVEIRSLKFICPTSKSKSIPAIEYTNIAVNINSSSNCQIKDISIEQFSGIAILCSGSSDNNRCSNILIDRVKVRNWYDTYEGSFPQIWFFKYVYDSVVQNSSLEGGTFGIGFYDAYSGIEIRGRGKNIPGAGVYRCSAINNIIKDQTRYGILLYCTRSVAFPNELVQHVIKGNTISNILGSSHVKEKGFGAGIYAVGVTDLTISNNNVSNCNQLTTSASLAPGCIGIVGCFGNIVIDGNNCSDGKWSNLYLNNINADRTTGQMSVTNNTLSDSVRENLFCSNCNNATFDSNKISSGRFSRLSPVSFRSVRNVTFKNNIVFFDSAANQDAMFLYQSRRLMIANNAITTLNPISINRVQEVSESLIIGNVYNSANPSSEESVRFLNSTSNQFIGNIINKSAGGRTTREYNR